MNELLLGDSRKLLRELEDNSIDTVVTDPPYGLEFMAKDWDKTLPPKEIWTECLRVLKPGAFAFIMCASRSNLMARLIIDLEDAGFITEFTPIFWTYATGFPKATKLKDGAFAGFQPKPAVEPVIVVMKPLDESTYKAQFEANKHGATWLDNARIPVGEDPRIHTIHLGQSSEDRMSGRFPANLVVSDDSLNTGEIHKSGKLEKHHKYSANSYLRTNTFKMRDRTGEIETYGDEGSYSRFFDLDAWFYSSILKNLEKLPDSVRKTYPFLVTPKPSVSEKNAGLTDLQKAEPSVFGFRPTLKTHPENWEQSITETPYGGPNRSGEQHNPHPTVKPIKLMSYLVTLGSQEGDTVLDPFVGSGTTAIACALTNRKGIGMEVDGEYFKIAWKRLSYWKEIKKHEVTARNVLEGL